MFTRVLGTWLLLYEIRMLSLTYPNSTFEIQKRVDAHRVTWTPTLVMLVIRSVLFAVFQALIALVFFAWGVPRAWDVSAAWWMLAATLTNVVCIVLLMQLFRREGMRYRDLLRIERGRVGRDLLLILGMLIVSIPLAMIPSIGLGTLLFGDANATSELMFRPLPTASAFLLLFLFPITVGLAELPTYFGYVMPRLAVLSGRPWLALSVASSFLAIQHCALPLLFDGRFLAWRLLMFLPFAFFAGLVLKWRPQLMPYMIAVHIFMDFQAAWIVLNLSL